MTNNSATTTDLSSISSPISRIFFITAVIYLISLPFTPYPYQYSVKALPIFILALSCFTLLDGKHKWLMSIALLFSFIGDIFLAIEFTMSFQYGLLSFLIAHIFYSIYFIKLPNKTNKYKLISIIAICAFSVIAASIIIPAANALMVPVAVYLIVITLMAVIAFYKSINRKLLFGVICFLLSDTLLAINMFVSPIPLASLWVMLTYYSAQFFIFSGAMQFNRR
ncbi:membrane protein [Thalassotalea loyana]|uniref:Membrane protein n=1 Tax=Thalassotalea loyana TaxID=280483 RepID=A0ABQ6HF87_9GAMM|nr:lysoplasmalogenase [Thalassotalea loyana]GLX86758.1 membrane protein [Thalassotalea loyana]